MTRLNRRIYRAALPAHDTARPNGRGLVSWLTRLLGPRPRRRRTLNG